MKERAIKFIQRNKGKEKAISEVWQNFYSQNSLAFTYGNVEDYELRKLAKEAYRIAETNNFDGQELLKLYETQESREVIDKWLWSYKQKLLGI